MKVGDVVVLKSGGPVMTVIRRVKEEWECVWSINGLLDKGFFSEEILDAYIGIDNNGY